MYIGGAARPLRTVLLQPVFSLNMIVLFQASLYCQPPVGVLVCALGATRPARLPLSRVVFLGVMVLSNTGRVHARECLGACLSMGALSAAIFSTGRLISLPVPLQSPWKYVHIHPTHPSSCFFCVPGKTRSSLVVCGKYTSHITPFSNSRLTAHRRLHNPVKITRIRVRRLDYSASCLP